MPTFTDARGVEVHYLVEPSRSPTPRAVIQLAHGLGEHAERYRPLIDRLAGSGYEVWADDHRGHGATGLGQWDGDVSRLGRLGPGGHRAAMDDVRMLSAIIRDEHPDLPLVMIGHSWGSILAQKAVDDGEDYDALVLTGTAYRMPGSMSSGGFNRRFHGPGATGHEWLSRDPDVQRAFADDPLTFDADVLRLFGVADGLRLFGRPALADRSGLPVLVLIGSEDPLGGPASVARLERAYRRRSGVRDITTRVYDGARHEVFNETNRDEVIDDLLAWLGAHLRRDHLGGPPEKGLRGADDPAYPSHDM